MQHFTGVVVSPGIAEGRVFIFKRQELTFKSYSIQDPEAEKARLTAAASATVNEISTLVEKVRGNMGTEFAHIFRSQQTIAEDESILGEVVDHIFLEKVCAEAALDAVFGTYRALFAELPDEDYNKGRVADIEDVYKRILRNLLGYPEATLAHIPAGSVIIAEDLFPSDTAEMDPGAVVAMVTQFGGPTSHTSIMSKNLGIPAAVQVSGILDAVSTEDWILVENTVNNEAKIVVNPDPKTSRLAAEKAQKMDARRKHLAKYRGVEPRTIDGKVVILSANIGSTEELVPASEAGSRSVGLYRSEFLFLGTPTIPNEESQYQAYRAAVETFREGFVVFRTLDIGGDKTLRALPLPKEDNPFLGNRGLRFCLTKPDLFRTQLRAMLRASAHGKAKIMFPMVGSINELNEALNLLNEVRNDLEKQQVLFDRKLEIGIMIEIPSAVFVADALAKRVDFFSIGTNDLTQYLLAADRLNPEVARYYRPYDPSIFAVIQRVVDAASTHGCWVGICGELGGTPMAIPALLGLGVTELSMSTQSLDEATAIVCQGRMHDFRELSKEVLSLESDHEIEVLLNRYYTQIGERDQ